MQTPAEKRLVDELIHVLNSGGENTGDPPRILNIGAGRSLSIETQLARAQCAYIADRTDVDDCAVDHPSVGRCWTCSAEAMPDVGSSNYVAAFANYVLEHVPDVGSAAREIYRVLEPSGRFIVSVPNPMAPEFVVSRWTPLWLHRLVRGGEAWETHYGYQSVDDLKRLFEGAGFRTADTCYYCFTEGYLARFPIINLLARLYDRSFSALGIRRFLGNVCVIFEKPA